VNIKKGPLAFYPSSLQQGMPPNRTAAFVMIAIWVGLAALAIPWLFLTI
jgi:hypothetical protein